MKRFGFAILIFAALSSTAFTSNGLSHRRHSPVPPAKAAWAAVFAVKADNWCDEVHTVCEAQGNAQESSCLMNEPWRTTYCYLQGVHIYEVCQNAHNNEAGSHCDLSY